ncbi:MAG TPA: DUF1707 domain-containing protein [Actinophytocola sp.]|uniref:DUF1707 SHOCT-like domain-containing protein n=1 Tax=Actinophytocola sp. TaxID=1872138 RepID=UPI002DBD8337|nr:DUF1707 domain-containing protein [Actinophytocola sp.]HEU5469210.1 DUF1707 domain-containing protein [Actinophytocola sp.]
MVDDGDEQHSGPPDSRMLRVSDAERRHVVGVLEKAVGQGLLTLEEFSARTDRALSAQTRGELNSVLIDLPDIRHRELVGTEQPLVLSTGAGTVRQHGRWTVPRTIKAECGMGTISIDFTTAVCPHSEVSLHATVGAGTVTVIVPRGWTVVLVEAISRSGSVVNKATDPPDPTMPVLRVYGRSGMGTVRIRHPRGRGR